MVDAAWNDDFIASLRIKAGPQHLATRAAERIAAKGFDLLHVTKQAGRPESFGWGRSSRACMDRTIWTLQFSDETGVPEFHVAVVGIATTYTKRNPYDRVPSSNGKVSWSMQANDETKAVLGWATAHPAELSA